MGIEMWNVLRYPGRNDLTGRAQVLRTFFTIGTAQQFIRDEIAAKRGEAWDYGIERATACDYCRKRPAVGHDGIAAYCKECKK